ncbi:MAG: low molecular weight phosphotyrosine protein phosphatase [Flavobacteriaceae bacterium]|nr:low molecular weight phosphotyrosine protein phosphatase [Flavobacteriaceae bacterium]MDG1912762.1 low molecular weight phosphotyrosine protein phosphatase [Flavobacteriaceae bacterium]
MEQTKILMVCLGNICRSPLAQGILESKVKDLNIEVDSAGTAAYHIGNSPDPRSINVAKKYGIDISHQKARQFSQSDFSAFSHIFAMDRSNYENILSKTTSTEDHKKVNLILKDQNEVPDPYYGGPEGFENCFRLLNNACDLIIKSLKNE